MNVSQKTTLALSCVLGTTVLLSYVPIAKEQIAGTHDYWVGMPVNTQRMFYALMLLAAVGFVAFVVNYASTPVPQKGLLSYSPIVVPVLVGLLLVGAIAWSVSVMYYVRSPSTMLKVACIASLVVTAACGMLLLAGYAETTAPKWYILLGLIAFCTVVVLCDGVAWSAKLALH
jgi:hypothetical protein